jgi:hypothetical protein
MCVEGTSLSLHAQNRGVPIFASVQKNCQQLEHFDLSSSVCQSVCLNAGQIFVLVCTLYCPLIARHLINHMFYHFQSFPPTLTMKTAPRTTAIRCLSYKTFYQRHRCFAKISQGCFTQKVFLGILKPGNTKGGSITVPMTSCLTGLELAV